MAKVNNINEWHKIGDKLTTYLGTCSCQRKLKGIVTVLLSIKHKIESREFNMTSEEYLICSLLENTTHLGRNVLLIHGINCEYPILGNEEFWQWLEEIKDDPNLEDN